jgi:hypothetical protein
VKEGRLLLKQIRGEKDSMRKTDANLLHNVRLDRVRRLLFLRFDLQVHSQQVMRFCPFAQNEPNNLAPVWVCAYCTGMRRILMVWLVTISLGAKAEQLSIYLDAERIPVLGERKVEAAAPAPADLIIEPAKFTTEFLGQTQTVEQRVRYSSAYKLTESVSASYEISTLFQRLDPLGSIHPEPERQTIVQSNLASLRVVPFAKMSLAASAGSRLSMDPSVSAAETTLHTGASATVEPIAHTTLKLETSQADTTNLQGDILSHDAYSASIARKLAPLPVTLQLRYSHADGTREAQPDFLEETDRAGVALQWDVSRKTTFSTGIDLLESEERLSLRDSEGRDLFAQWTVKPVEILQLSFRTDYGTRESTLNDVFLENRETLQLSLGIAARWSETLRTGLSIKRIFDESIASSQSTILTLSASATF